MDKRANVGKAVATGESYQHVKTFLNTPYADMLAYNLQGEADSILCE